MALKLATNLHRATVEVIDADMSIMVGLCLT
jgi:hypothetical protein